MSMMTRRAAHVFLIFLAFLSPRAFAAAAGGAGAIPVAPPTAPANNNGGDSRVAGALVLIGGVIAIGAGTFLVVSKSKRIGEAGVQENGLVPLGLGIGAGGVAMAMVGAFLWFRVPQTSTRVAAGPSGLLLSGSF